MAVVRCGLLCVILLFSLVWLVSTERMKNKIYDSIDGAAACFRRLNGTHQFGCSSARLGNVGVIHIAEDAESITWLLEEGTANPYVVVLRPVMFTRENLLALKNSGKINGVILVNNGSSDRPAMFSHEDSCPNRYSGLSSYSYQTCNASDPWNPVGTALMMVDWGFPIFYVNTEASVNKLYKCFSTFNSLSRNKQSDRPLCAVEMNAFMLATVNSATCIRRSSMITNFNPIKFCDPLGDRNIWSTLLPRSKLNESREANRSLIVVSARLDTSSMFDGVTPGAVSPTTGIVALLATAEALSKMVPRNANYDTNVMFTLLNGESYDYIGSSRMVWDMDRDAFPVPLDSQVKDQPPLLKARHLKMFVELSHLAAVDRRLLYLQSPISNNIQVHTQVSEFVNSMVREGRKVNLTFISKENRVPPASYQSFLSADPKLPGLVIADYEDEFSTPYYHSIFDDKIYLNYTYQNGSSPPVDSIQGFIANFSTALACVLYEMVSDKFCDGSIAADRNTVDELFHCYLDKVNCSLFQAATFKQPLIDRPVSLYVGVNTWAGQNAITQLTGQAMAYLTGEVVNHTEDQCHNNPQQQVFQYIWMNGDEKKNESGVCIKTTMNYSTASSPAFEMISYDWKSGKFSTWTESVWQELNVRIFLKPARHQEIFVFSMGVVVLVLSFVAVYFINSRSEILFGNTLSPAVC